MHLTPWQETVSRQKYFSAEILNVSWPLQEVFSPSC